MTSISLFVGTVFGQATKVAEAVEKFLTNAGHTVSVFIPGSVEDFKQSESILICTSTTGSGDIPAELEDVYYELKDVFPLLTHKKYGIITLGDSSYGDTFCGSGVKFDELLQELQADRVLDPLKIDACETTEPEKWAVEWLPLYLDKISAD